VQFSEIQDRVKALQREIADLRAANHAYVRRQHHSTVEVNEHKQRELRLHQILEELARLRNQRFLEPFAEITFHERRHRSGGVTMVS
jgi:vacuolar-type H+-ATPase subunit I/STV1